MNELEALSILAQTAHLGSIKIRLLLKHYGSALAALSASRTEIEELPGFGVKIGEQWLWWSKRDSWQRDFEDAEREGVQILPFTSPHYPQRLLEISDYPILLYVKGTLKAEDRQSLAVIGTRAATIYGLEMAERGAEELTERGFAVVSGLARGIDTAAHRGALRRGRTLAVIGSGLSAIYPKENSSLAQEIAEKGALISEFPMHRPPDRQSFPQRNRIVSGMTMGTFLVEAPLQSGAMITVERALQQQRKVFALPGRADGENFRGNHALIKSGEAYLVESGAEVAAHFGDLFGKAVTPLGRKELPPLEREEEAFLKQFPQEEISCEALLHKTQLPVAKLQVLLMSLLLKKVIKEYPGKVYKKIMP